MRRLPASMRRLRALSHCERSAVRECTLSTVMEWSPLRLVGSRSAAGRDPATVMLTRNTCFGDATVRCWATFHVGQGPAPTS